MDIFNLYDAKTNLSRLVERAAGGEEIIIAKAGRAMARLVPLTKREGRRPLGLFEGQIEIGPDFDALDKDIEDSFHASEIFGNLEK